MNPRIEAFKILKKVFKNCGYSNILISDLIKSNRLNSKDLSLCVNLIYGTIQYKIFLEYVANKIIDPLKTVEDIQILLWLSIYQFHFLDSIPDYAIINTAVEISKGININYAKLVNKVLRTLQENKSFFDVNIKNKKNIFPLKNGFPLWLFNKIKNDFSDEIANKIIIDSTNKPLFSIRVNDLKISYDEFYKKNKDKFNLEKSKISKYSFISDPSILRSSDFEEGLFIVQDQLSSYVTEILDPKENSRVLDMCSAPGGKTVNLACLMKNTGTLTACEISSAKLSLIKNNIYKFGIKNTGILNIDSTIFCDETKYDYILLDAPCSGVGVLKRKPEIKLKKPSSIFNSELIKIQWDLLVNAINLLDNGGTLVYSTCTINIDENTKQIEKFLSTFKNIELIFESQYFGFENNTDGFYIAKLKKIL